MVLPVWSISLVQLLSQKPPQLFWERLVLVQQLVSRLYDFCTSTFMKNMVQQILSLRSTIQAFRGGLRVGLRGDRGDEGSDLWWTYSCPCRYSLRHSWQTSGRGEDSFALGGLILAILTLTRSF